MNIGDIVFIKYTEITGTIVREISPRWYKAKFPGFFSDEEVSMREDDLELKKPVSPLKEDKLS